MCYTSIMLEVLNISLNLIFDAADLDRLLQNKVQHKELPVVPNDVAIFPVLLLIVSVYVCTVCEYTGVTTYKYMNIPVLEL